MYFPSSLHVGIFPRLLSVPHNTITVLNNVMKANHHIKYCIIPLQEDKVKFGDQANGVFNTKLLMVALAVDDTSSDK